MAKYTFDVYFDIPKEILNKISDKTEEAQLQVACSTGFLNIWKPETDDEYTTLRIAVKGSDASCQRTARKLKIRIDKQTFTADGFEIVHCQG